MTEDTSHLEDKQTPEMVSNQIKAEAEGKASPEKPEEKPVEKPAEPKPEEKPEDKKPEEKPEEKKPEDNLPTKPRTIYDDYKDKKKEVKENETTIETLKSQLAEKDTQIADLTEKAKHAETPAEKKEISDEIKSIAEDIGASPEGIAKLTDFLTKVVKPTESGLSDEDKQALAEFRQSKSQRDAQDQFTSEWGKFEPALKTEFPNVSAEDLANVKKEVDRLAHTAQYNTFPVDYIYFKEKGNLEKLISPKRPSYEGSDNKPAIEQDAEVELSNRSSPMDAQKATEKRSTSQLEIRSSGK